jgi:two-component system cell cycle response regulator PopA
MVLQARLLIAARNDEMAGPLSEGLDQLGWRTLTARGPYAAVAALTDLGVQAVVIDLADGLEEAEALARKLRGLAEPRRIPIIAIGGGRGVAASTAFDLRLADPVYPAQVAMRLDSLVRTAVAEEEYRLRQETFARMGVELADPELSDEPLRLLAVGEPTPQFLGLSNCLEAAGARVVGAFTSYTAFDFLHEADFDTVVLWGGDAADSAMAIAGGMRRNSRLYHIPTLLYMKTLGGMTAAEAYSRGISDVASQETPEPETAWRALELARSYRRQAGIRAALESARSLKFMDAETGLFTRELFAQHLSRLADAAPVRNRPLALCVLRLRDTEEVAEARRSGWLEKAFPQLGSMVSRLIRVEDTAARLGPEHFAVALPATPIEAARAAADRIAAVISRTAFDGGEGRPPFVLEFDIGTVEVGGGAQVDEALEQASVMAGSGSGAWG